MDLNLFCGLHAVTHFPLFGVQVKLCEGFIADCNKRQKKKKPACRFLMPVLCFCKSVAAKASPLLPVVPQETAEVQSPPTEVRGSPSAGKRGQPAGECKVKVEYKVTRIPNGVKFESALQVSAGVQFELGSIRLYCWTEHILVQYHWFHFFFLG